MQRDELLRTFGILPERTASVRGPIRSSLTKGNIIGQWIAFALFGIGPLLLGIRTTAVRIAEGIFGRIKGFEFRFPDMKQGVRVFRADPAMTQVRELLEGVVAQMNQFGEVVPEIVDLDGLPLVRRLTLER